MTHTDTTQKSAEVNYSLLLDSTKNNYTGLRSDSATGVMIPNGSEKKFPFSIISSRIYQGTYSLRDLGDLELKALLNSEMKNIDHKIVYKPDELKIKLSLAFEDSEVKNKGVDCKYWQIKFENEMVVDMLKILGINTDLVFEDFFELAKENDDLNNQKRTEARAKCYDSSWQVEDQKKLQNLLGSEYSVSLSETKEKFVDSKYGSIDNVSVEIYHTATNTCVYMNDMTHNGASLRFDGNYIAKYKKLETVVKKVKEIVKSKQKEISRINEVKNLSDARLELLNNLFGKYGEVTHEVEIKYHGTGSRRYSSTKHFYRIDLSKQIKKDDSWSHIYAKRVDFFVHWHLDDDTLLHSIDIKEVDAKVNSDTAMEEWILLLSSNKVSSDKNEWSLNSVKSYLMDSYSEVGMTSILSHLLNSEDISVVKVDTKYS